MSEDSDPKPVPEVGWWSRPITLRIPSSKTAILKKVSTSTTTPAVMDLAANDKACGKNVEMDVEPCGSNDNNQLQDGSTGTSKQEVNLESEKTPSDADHVGEIMELEDNLEMTSELNPLSVLPDDDEGSDEEFPSIQRRSEGLTHEILQENDENCVVAGSITFYN